MTACQNVPFALLRRLAQVLAFVLLVVFSGCGGGGSNGGPPNPPPPTEDFSLSVAPSSQSLNAGNSISVQISTTAVNGFSSTINVQASVAAVGVSASPLSFSLAPGASQQITVSAAAGAVTASGTVTFTGTSGTLTHTAKLAVNVMGTGSNGAPVRTRYIRTDATTEYYQWLNPHWGILSPLTSLFYVTDPVSSQVFVIDPSTESKVASISVPGAFGIDDTPDHKTLYVGTLLGDVYAVDPLTMSVTQRYLAAQIGPYGFSALNAEVMADGRLALLGEQGGIPSVDGSTAFALWNPADNSINVYGGQLYGLPIPCGGFFGNIGGFSRTVDRSKIVLASIDSDATLCEVDESSGQGNYVAGSSFLMNRLTMSPDGKYIIIPSYTQSNVTLYDAQTLNVVAQFSVSGDTSSDSGFFVSADSTTLFTPTDEIIYAYDLTSHQQIGWTPNINVPISQGGGAVGPIAGPNFQAEDSTGLLMGPQEEGVGFVDVSNLRTGAVGTQFTNGYLSPATGPASGGTSVQWADPNPLGSLKSIYFGASPATAISASSGLIRATSPTGVAGTADIYAFTNDGGMQLLPEGFSYGPTILEVTPDKSTLEGGGLGAIYGYGFGPTSSNSIPSGLQVTVAGTAATIVGFNGNATGNAAPPFPTQTVFYTIPPGVMGTVDVTVTTSSGTATAGASFTYLPPLQKFAFNGSTLAQGIYDPHRDLYYFTDRTQVQVFSRTQGKVLTPITIPPPAGAVQRLWALALSPDGTKLAVADALAGVIYVLDPSTPTSVKTYVVGSNNGAPMNPIGVAISDAGMAYYTTYTQGISGARSFFKLDTNTGTIVDYDIAGPGFPLDVYLRTVISSDNTRAYFNDDGYVFSVDTATDKIFSATVDPACCYGDYDLTLSSNQVQFEATSYLYDSNLDPQSFLALNDREILNIGYVYGTKFSPDGSLLFQPSTNGIDVFDGRLGNLRTRISLPVALSENYDALVADGKDNVLLAITGATGNGIAIVDLTSLSEPSPLPYEAAHRMVDTPLLQTVTRPAKHSGAQSRRIGSRLSMIPHATGTADHTNKP
jgi:YVTN family beta-propeller protein